MNFCTPAKGMQTFAFHLGRIILLGLFFLGQTPNTLHAAGLEIACRADINTCNTPGACFMPAEGLNLEAPFILDDGCGGLTISNDAPAIFPLGWTYITWTVTDTCGTSVSCSQGILIEDHDAPVLECAEHVYFEATGSDCVSWTILTPPNAYDNCGITSLTNDAVYPLQLGANVIVWTASDAYGNVSTCSQKVIVTDNQAPVIVGCPGDIFMDEECENGVFWPAPFATDNCGIASIISSHEPGSVFPQGETVVTYEVYDTYGNLSTCDFTVTVNCCDGDSGWDNCPTEDLLFVSEDACATATQAFWEEPIAWGCYTAISSSHTPGDLFDEGITTVNYVLVDGDGNERVCEFIVKIICCTEEANNFEDCPEDIVVTSDNCYDPIAVSWDPPVPNGTCFISMSSNYEPGELFYPGTSQTVEYIGLTESGDDFTCSFTVKVDRPLQLFCPNQIEISMEEWEAGFHMIWNGPEAVSKCEDCPGEHIPGFEFLGVYHGHYYFLFEGDPISFDEAQDMAASHGGYLSVIANSKENELIETNYETAVFTGAMLGIIDPDGDGIFETITGEPVTYTNFAPGFPEPGPSKAVILKDGTWETVPYQVGVRRYIMEIPCVDFEIITPDVANDDFYQTGYIGNVHYTATDICGNECDCDFDLVIKTEDAEPPCDGGAAFADHYIKALNFQRGGGNFSSIDYGYGDYYDINMSIVKSSPRFRVKSGSNPDDVPLYWSIWIDWNRDGDYYDDQELIFERTHPRGFDDQLVLPDFVEVGFSTTMRISVAQYQWPEPCGFYYSGEVEDYTITFTEDPSNNNAQIPEMQGLVVPNDPDYIWMKELDEEHLLVRENEETEWTATELAVFPNPAKDDQVFVDVSSLLATDGTLEIMDYQGRLLHTQAADFSQYRQIPVDISSFRNGLYVVSLRQNGSLVGSKTFIVQR